MRPTSCRLRGARRGRRSRRARRGRRSCARRQRARRARTSRRLAVALREARRRAHRVDQVVGGLDALSAGRSVSARARRRRRPRCRPDAGREVLGSARKAAHALAARLERVQKPAADVARGTGQQDQRTLRAGHGHRHVRATSSAAATRSPFRRRTPRRAESSSVAPGPASASGTARASGEGRQLHLEQGGVEARDDDESRRRRLGRAGRVLRSACSRRERGSARSESAGRARTRAG